MFAHRFGVLAFVSVVWITSLDPAVAEDSAEKVDENELMKLQGNWEPLSVVFDGQEVKIDDGTLFSFTLEGRTFTVRLQGKEAGKLEIKHLVANEPIGHIDFERKEVNGMAVTDEGRVKMLYKLEGEMLTTCAGLPGADRPSEFASKPGSKSRLTVVKIKKK